MHELQSDMKICGAVSLYSLRICAQNVDIGSQFFHSTFYNTSVDHTLDHTHCRRKPLAVYLEAELMSAIHYIAYSTSATVNRMAI